MDNINLVLCAIAAAALDICSLVLIITSYCEKKSGRKSWSKISANMELADNSSSYALECDEILIGRHASADIRLLDLSVSRYHAMLNVTDGKWTITDTGGRRRTSTRFCCKVSLPSTALTPDGRRWRGASSPRWCRG